MHQAAWPLRLEGVPGLGCGLVTPSQSCKVSGEERGWRVQFTTHPWGRGKANWGLQKPLPQAAHIFMKTAMALLTATVPGSQRTSITSCSPDISVPAATVTHTVRSRSRHVFILLLCDMVCFSASAKDQSVLLGLDYGPARSLETRPVLVSQTTWPANNPQLSPHPLSSERCMEGNRP